MEPKFRYAEVGLYGGKNWQRVISLCRLFVQPLFSCAIVIILWHIMIWTKQYYPPAIVSMVENTHLQWVGAIHGALAVFLLVFQSSENWSKMIDAFELGEDDEFVRLIHKQANPPPVKYVLRVTGAATNLLSISFPVSNYNWNLILVFIVAFIVAILWEMLMEMENPTDGIWAILNIPLRLAERVRDLNLPKRRMDRFWEWLANRVAPAKS